MEEAGPDKPPSFSRSESVVMIQAGERVVGLAELGANSFGLRKALEQSNIKCSLFSVTTGEDW